MDMNDVKSIYDNSVGKEVKKIQDGNGNVIWYKVPDGYRKVEYLESDGNQYFDSGVEAKYSIGLHTKFQCLSNVNAAICGAINNITTGYNSRHHLTLYGSGIYWYYYNSNRTSATFSAPNLSFTGVNTFYLNTATGVVKINDNTGTFTALQGTVGSNYGIFGRLSNTLAIQSRPVKIFWFILMDSNVVVRHFIPVVRNSDNKPGMYDLVNDVFYTNQGTGEFTWGEL